MAGIKRDFVGSGRWRASEGFGGRAAGGASSVCTRDGAWVKNWNGFLRLLTEAGIPTAAGGCGFQLGRNHELTRSDTGFQSCLKQWESPKGGKEPGIRGAPFLDRLTSRPAYQIVMAFIELAHATPSRWALRHRVSGAALRARLGVGSKHPPESSQCGWRDCFPRNPSATTGGRC